MSSERKLDPNAPSNPSQSWWASQNENIRILAIAITLALLLRAFVLEPRFIPSASMEPTMQINDRIIVEKVSYRFTQPQRGEIIVFYPPKSPAVDDNSKAYIKRVIGLPGDRISIHDGQVFVNGQPLDEAYIAEPIEYTLPTPAQISESLPNPEKSRSQAASGNFAIVVPPDSYWVMGDNRNYSNDSHVWGFLPRQNIIGRAYLRFWPTDQRFGLLQTPKYRD